MVDIFFCSFVDFTDGFLGGGIDGLEGLAILAFDKLIVDEAAIIEVSLLCLRSRTLGESAEEGYHRIKCGVKPITGQELPLPTVQSSQCSELKKIQDEGETHSPVGCSYLPAAGVSKDTETDMLGDRSMGSCCYKFR